MKFQSFCSLALMASTLIPVSTAFVACDSDSDLSGMITNSAAVKAKGEYEGVNKIAVATTVQGVTANMPMGDIQNFSVSISPLGYDAVNLKLGKYDLKISDERSVFSHVVSNEVEFKNLPAQVQKDGTATFEGDVSNFGYQVEMLLATKKDPNGQTKSMYINKGNVKGSVSPDGTLSLTVSIQPGTMPMPIVYNITAKRK